MSQAISMETVMALYKNDGKDEPSQNMQSSQKLDQMA